MKILFPLMLIGLLLSACQDPCYVRLQQNGWHSSCIRTGVVSGGPYDGENWCYASTATCSPYGRSQMRLELVGDGGVIENGSLNADGSISADQPYTPADSCERSALESWRLFPKFTTGMYNGYPVSLYVVTDDVAPTEVISAVFKFQGKEYQGLNMNLTTTGQFTGEFMGYALDATWDDSNGEYDIKVISGGVTLGYSFGLSCPKL